MSSGVPNLKKTGHPKGDDEAKCAVSGGVTDNAVGPGSDILIQMLTPFRDTMQL